MIYESALYMLITMGLLSLYELKSINMYFLSVHFIILKYVLEIKFLVFS